MGDRCEAIETGDGRQRHGRHAHPGRTAEGGARAVRHRGVRRRAAPQLQPHPAVAGAGRRTDPGRDRAQLLGLVPGARHHPARRQEGGRGRPGAPRGARRGRNRGSLRPAAAVHRLQPLHAAGAGQSTRRRDRLPRHRRHQRHDRRGAQVQAGRGHRRRPAGPGGGQRPDAARHAGHRGARDALVDGAPARQRGRQTAAEVAGGTRPEVPDRRADAGTGRRRRPAGSRP